MIDAIIRWSLDNRLIVLVAVAGLIVWGIIQTQKMPVDVFPNLTAPTVTVVTEAHNMAPEEVEQLITRQIESALNGSSGVRRIRSATSVGSSIVWVEFEWGQDIYRARQIVTEKLQLVQSSLPPEVPPPVLEPVSSIMGEILFVGISSKTIPKRKLRTIADWEIRRRLLAVPGVSQVIPIGGAVQQFQVQVKPAALIQYDVSLEDVIKAVKQTNENTSAGFYEQGGQEYLIYGLGRVETLKDIAMTVIEVRDNVPIRVMDVANVVLGDRIKRGDGAINGQPGVVMGVQKQPNINTLTLTQNVQAVLGDIESGLPKGIKMHKSLMQQANFIQTSIDNIKAALRDGALLVILIVGVFLVSMRATFITAMAIPLSLLTAIIILHFMGASLNTMTLGGMAIAVGALVDDAIIDVENVIRRLRERQPQDLQETLTIVFEASKEIRASIVFATLIIILVFLPLFFLHGVEGLLLQPLGVAYIVSLAASLLVALTVTPVLCSLLLPKSNMVKRQKEPRLIHWLRENYEKLLERLVDRWAIIGGVSLIALCLSVGLLTQMGRAFLPEFNEGALTVSIVTSPGTSLEESGRLAHVVETRLLGIPEVASTARRTGRAELDSHAQGIHASELDVKLKPSKRSRAELLAHIRRVVSDVKGANIVLGQPISHRIDHMLSGTRANIAVKLYGEDLETLQRLAKQIQGKIKQVPNTVDVSLEEQTRLPFLSIKFNRAALMQYGLTIQQIAHTMETAFYGTTASTVLQGAYSFDLVVRFPKGARNDLETIKATRIRTPSGAWIPLSALATIKRKRGPSQITRENNRRKLVIMCNVKSGGSLVDVVNGIKAQMKATPLPQGYYVEYGGQYESAQSATKQLIIVGLLVILGIFLLLYVVLNSIRDALLVMLNLPLALIGGVVGIYVAGGIVSIAAIIGLITLFGIATRNGIMMVTHMTHLYQHDTNARKAVLQGASERLAPIFMTALASGLGLLPLALGMDQPGSEIQAPMAIVILFGLSSATLLNMIVVPAIMLRFGSIHRPETK